MKKVTKFQFAYLLAVLLVLLWVVFLFFTTKDRPHAELPSPPQQNTLPTPQPKAEKSQTSSFEQDFLTGQDLLSADRLDELSSLKEKIALLEQLFHQQQSKETADLLIKSYLLNLQFEAAKKTYFSLDETLKKQLDPRYPFTIGLNTFSQTSDTEYRALKTMLETFTQQGIFSAEERKYYAVVFALVEKRYADAKAGLKTLSSGEYADFAKRIEKAFEQYESLKDVPSYYQEGLIAYQLLQEGLIAPAKKIALPLLNQHPDYILPYQILAHIDFSLGKWQAAISYFSQLLELDYQEKNRYLYHLGVAYYQLQKYADAVLYLAQISDPSILLDSDRYLILSYIALGQEERVFAGWQRLLGYPSIKKSDFYSFFEEALWKPYRLGKASSYLQKNQKLIHAYQLACTKKLRGEDAEICSYGELGRKAQEGKVVAADEVLINRFARRTPKSEFFQLLGDLALQSGEAKKATSAYLKALSMTHQDEEKRYLKRLILKANALED